MMFLFRSLKYLSAIGLVGLCVNTLSYADDVDLYITTTTGSTDVNPNVLFIIDSSGSMDEVDVEVSTVTCTTVDDVEITGYDSTYDYPGSYDSDRIYFYSGASTAEAGDSPDGSFPSSENYCATAQSSLDSSDKATGHKLIMLKSWRSYTWWDDISHSTLNGTKIECQGDEGVHGEITGDAAVYANGEWRDANKWTSVSGDKYNSWDNSTYTLYNGNRLNYQTLVNAEDGSVTDVVGTTESCETTTTTEERLQVVKNVAKDLITSTSGINLGIMTFIDGGTEGGYVRKEVVDIDESVSGVTNRSILENVVDDIDHDGHTPLAETLYEAGRYFKSETPDFGSSSVAAAKDGDGSHYNSPITDSCQANNNIILLSDGQPYSDANNNNDLEDYLNAQDPDQSPDYDCPNERDTGNSGNSCLVEVADYLANNDLSTLSGDQVATLYTIGFVSDLDILEDAAQAGNGNYYQASSYSELSSTLNNIILRVLASDTTMLSPAVSVNAFNRLQHNDEIYYAMFSPDSDARWEGNLKKYTINDKGEILDAGDDSRNPAPAINTATGFFKDTSHSYWSPSADGANTNEGGARSKQDWDEDSSPRNVFTYTGGSAPGSAVNLNQAAHKVAYDNDDLTQAMLGVSSDEDRTAIISWARGYADDGTTVREYIGDPLHSRPTVVVYGGTGSDDQDTTVFFGTNEGFLHAIDGETGEEEFSFVPQALLPNLENYYRNTAGLKDYGLDGEVTVIKNDVNNNGVIYDSNGNLESDESVYLYIGMRRGGRNYYAFDVTDRSNPKLMWRIDGGSGEFAELGQSWSRPQVGKVKIGNTSTQVLIFGGGYDEDQDSATGKQTDDVGRSLFMVNATSGAIVWSAGPNNSDDLVLSGMNYSIPANVNAADIDYDGYTDIIFAANMGGEVWRFDIDKINTGAANLATGGRIVNINPDSTELNNRRFFSRPDVSLYSPRGEAPYYLVALGAGARPDPLNEVTLNRFYVVKEYSPYKAPTSNNAVSYTTKTEDDLYDATDNHYQDGTDEQKATAKSELATSSGWYIDLEGNGNRGEKVLSGSTTFGGRIIFTSYTPDFTTVSGSCELNLGKARLYVLNILSGSAAVDFNDDGVIDGDDLYTDLKHSGIPSGGSIIYAQTTEDDGVTKVEGQTTKVLCVGTECFADVLNDIEALQKTYWREEQ